MSSDGWDPALVAGRWSWQERAEAWLRHEVFGQEAGPPDTGATNVMVVGDTQAGKTTLLIRLLGVTDPRAVAEIHEVLRAGRARGNSATAAPIRYRWSSDPDTWMLVAGTGDPRWLGDEEMAAEFARLRSGGSDRLAWDLNARPLEVGLPTRLGGAERKELRVLDLPGVFAASAAERDAAHALVTRFAPVMSVILLVEKVDNITGLEDAAIRENPHLQNWMRRPERFRIVLTSAFKDRNVRRRAKELDDPAEIVEEVRTYLADNIESTVPGAESAVLAPAVYPVDLGDSWDDLERTAPEYAARVKPARDQVLEQLTRELAEATDEDAQRLAAPELAIRIAEDIRTRAVARSSALAAREAARAGVSAELADADQVVDRAFKDLYDKRAVLVRYETARTTWAAGRSPTSGRPGPRCWATRCGSVRTTNARRGSPRPGRCGRAFCGKAAFPCGPARCRWTSRASGWPTTRRSGAAAGAGSRRCSTSGAGRNRNTATRRCPAPTPPCARPSAAGSPRPPLRRSTAARRRWPRPSSTTRPRDASATRSPPGSRSWTPRSPSSATSTT